MKNTLIESKPYSNPYLAGIFLGLVLLVSFLTLGAGLGASGGIARISAQLEQCVLPAHTKATEYFGNWGSEPLYYYLVFMLAGVFIGALVSAILARRFKPQLEKGKAASSFLRAILALIGGLLVGFTSRLASGCTSGQALTGTAQLMTGSIIFLACIFAGGYAAAWFVRSQWND